AEITGALDEAITLDQDILGKYHTGMFGSPKIGPAKRWGRLVSGITYSEDPVNDIYSYDVIGIDLNNRESLIHENISLKDFSLESIDASTYPLIKLRLHISDETDLSPVRPQKWMVLYEPMPEGILLLAPEYERTLPVVHKPEGEALEVGY